MRQGTALQHDPDVSPSVSSAELMKGRVVLILEETQAAGPGRESVLVSGQKDVRGWSQRVLSVFQQKLGPASPERGIPRDRTAGGEEEGWGHRARQCLRIPPTPRTPHHQKEAQPLSFRPVLCAAPRPKVVLTSRAGPMQE